MIKNKSIIILSGGLDSSILMYDILDRQTSELTAAICFDYGQRHKKEIKCAEYLCDLNDIPLKIIDLGFFKDLTAGACSLTDASIDVPTAAEAIGDAQHSAYVPNRNMMMLSIAVSYAESVGAKEVYYGAGGDDEHSGYWDCTNEFLKNINDVILLNRKNKIQIYAPYTKLSKAEIIKRGADMKAPLENTWTCYNGREKSCGKCPTCANRLKAFISNKLIDPMEYEIDLSSVWEKYNCREIK